MKHAKFVSFTLCGAQTVQKAVKLLPDFRCERYARTADASLSGTSLKRFAQQAMVDCDLIVFVDVLISLIKNTEWTNKYCMYWGLRLYDLNLF